jgi:L-ascorbate metabolism protein UlaG (beta-lactamase superfamily)
MSFAYKLLRGIIMKLTWSGHSAFLLQSEKTNVLIDPFLSGNPSAPKDLGLPKIDFILLTHGHGDHVGDTIELAKKHDATVVGIYDLTSWLGHKGVAKTTGMNKGGTVKLSDDLTVTMTHAIHSSSFEEDGTNVYLGEAAGFVIRMGAHVIYAAGDTDVFSDMKLIQELYEPTIGILPIGDHFTMSPTSAAYACNNFLSLEKIIPCHYGTFGALTGTAEEFKKLVKRGDVVAPKVGEVISL